MEMEKLKTISDLLRSHHMTGDEVLLLRHISQGNEPDFRKRSLDDILENVKIMVKDCYDNIAGYNKITEKEKKDAVLYENLINKLLKFIGGDQ